MCSVRSGGSNYAVFRRVLDRGDLAAVRAAAAELPGPPPLDDALAICMLLLEHEPDRYERGAVRWLGRLLLERRAAELRQAELAAAYLAALAEPARRQAAAGALAELGSALGLVRLGERIRAGLDG
jgi:hypothetical protein